MAEERIMNSGAESLRRAIALGPCVLLACLFAGLTLLGGCSGSSKSLNNDPMPVTRNNEARTADKAFESGDYAAARNIYSNLLQDGPVDYATALRLGISQLRLNENEDALKSLTLAVRLAPEQAQPYYNRGLALHQLEEWDEAIYDFRKAADLSAGRMRARALNNAALCFHLKGEPEIAVELFNEAVHADPGYLDAIYNRGTVYAELRLYQPALDDFRTVLGRAPQHVNARNNLGITLMQQGEYQQAAEEFHKGLAQAPERADLYFNLGVAKYRAGEHGQAVTAFTRAIGRRPDFAQAYNNRGAAYVAMDENEEGCADLTHACDMGLCEMLERMQRKRECP